jgi:hypothetical protein
MEKAKCFECRFRRNIYTDTVSRCNNKAASVKQEAPSAENNWYFWPYAYDPNRISDCNGFLRKFEN